MHADEATCAQLAKRGDSLVIPRPVSHWVYFKKSSGREGFARWAEANGFTVERLYATRIRFRRQYVIEISSVTTADLPTISAMTRQLSTGDHGGDYDGWESPIIDGADSQPRG